MSLLNILLVLVLLSFFGVLPVWGHSHNWGYAPSGGLFLLVILLLVLSSRGRLNA